MELYVYCFPVTHNESCIFSFSDGCITYDGDIFRAIDLILHLQTLTNDNTSYFVSMDQILYVGLMGTLFCLNLDKTLKNMLVLWKHKSSSTNCQSK